MFRHHQLDPLLFHFQHSLTCTPRGRVALMTSAESTLHPLGGPPRMGAGWWSNGTSQSDTGWLAKRLNAGIQARVLPARNAVRFIFVFIARLFWLCWDYFPFGLWIWMGMFSKQSWHPDLNKCSQNNATLSCVAQREAVPQKSLYFTQRSDNNEATFCTRIGPYQKANQGKARPRCKCPHIYEVGWWDLDLCIVLENLHTAPKILTLNCFLVERSKQRSF